MNGLWQVCIKELLEYSYRPFNFLKIAVVAIFILIIVAELSLDTTKPKVSIGAQQVDLFSAYDTELENLQSMPNVQLYQSSITGKSISFYFAENHADVVILLREKDLGIYYRTYLSQQEHELKRFAQSLALTLDYGPVSVNIFNAEDHEDYLKSLEKVSDHYLNRSSRDIAMILKINLLFAVFIAFAINAISLPKELEANTLYSLITARRVNWAAIFMGKTLAACIIALITFVLVLVISIVFYGVPIGVPQLSLLFILLLGILSSALFGFVVSTVVNTQLQAYMFSVLYFLCLLLLADFSYPIATLPLFSQVVAWFLPLSFMIKPLCSWSLYGANEYGDYVLFLVAQCLLYGFLCKYRIKLFRKAL